MREIKFRAKSIETGKWEYGYLVQSGEWSRGDESDADNEIWWQITNGYTTKKVDSNTIGQYIGLKDKNGKEIYEGDIVFCYDGEFSKTCKIEWCDENAQFIGVDIYTDDSYLMQEIFGEIVCDIY